MHVLRLQLASYHGHGKFTIGLALVSCLVVGCTPGTRPPSTPTRPHDDARGAPLVQAEASAEAGSERAVAESHPQRTQLTPPFTGAWAVGQGYEGSDTHFGRAAYALDLVKLGPDLQAYRRRGARLRDWYSFGAPARATADGLIVTVVDHHPDNPVFGKSRQANRVIIQHAPAEFSEFVHLRQGSVRVKVGERVRRGQIIARCGNSGAETPHLHWAFLSSITPIRTRPAKIVGYDVREADRWHPSEGIPKSGDVVRSCPASCQPECRPWC